MQQLKNALVTVALAATLAVASHARAYAEPQTRTLYNERGQEVGRSITRGNTTTHKDAWGGRLGARSGAVTGRRTTTMKKAE
jgi:hypothetical protein